MAGSRIEKRREVLSVDKAFARAALYDLAGSCGSLTGRLITPERLKWLRAYMKPMPAEEDGHLVYRTRLCRIVMPYRFELIREIAA